MKIHSYYSSSGKDVILEYIDSLTVDEQVDGYSVLECLEKGETDKLIIKTWQKKVKEVYFRKHNRIFFIIVDGNDIYLLHACRKQKNKTEKQDSKIVIKRAKQLEKELKTNKKFYINV